ncbi:MAG: preprotein translocase subunit SecG [Bacteroidales bacterium]|jgi:preprotein translocase subunit SecG|nr:preprotein translocase subunit SecG [Bacteroidales bacterium]
MYNFIVILILIVSVLLAIVVLVQNSKGGGLAANFSAPNQIMGVRKTTDFLEKATWTLAAALIVLSLIATISIHSGKKEVTQRNVVNAEQVDQTSSAANAMQSANQAQPEAAPQQ